MYTYLQNLSFELDGHRLRHRLDFVDELDACISSDRHHSVALSVSLFAAGRLACTVAVRVRYSISRLPTTPVSNRICSCHYFVVGLTDARTRRDQKRAERRVDRLALSKTLRSNNS